MTKADITELGYIVLAPIQRKEKQQKVRGFLRNKKCITVIKELKLLKSEFTKQQYNKVVLVVVLALLFRNIAAVRDIKDAIDEERMIGNLFGGLMIFLGGKSPNFSVSIKWNDSQFSNRYTFINRFAGQFEAYENREILNAVRIIALSDQAKFEELVLKDITRLVFLNLEYIDVEPTNRLLTRLLIEGDDLQANIAFTHCVRDINMDIRDYHDLEKCPEYARVQSKEQIHENIKMHLEVFDAIWIDCPNERKCSLLLNYILYEKEYPNQFGFWLMEKANQNYFVYVITESDKIKNLNDLSKVCGVVNYFPCKASTGKCARKDKYYDAIVKVLKKFIRERKGIYKWEAGEVTSFRQICCNLPKRYKYILKRFLEQESKKYMISRLDEMVRFSFYLKDKQQWDICNGMFNILSECGI